MRFSYVRYLLLTFLIALPAVQALGQPGPATTFSLLRLEPSARAAALGGAFAAVYGDDVNGLFHNPALLNETMHRTLAVSYLNHLAGVNMGAAAYARHLDGIGTVGAGLRYLGWGEVEGYDAAGESTEDFRAGDAALTASFSRSDEGRLRYGANLHAILSSIGSHHASAVAADVGIAYHLDQEQLTVSASANNVGVVLNSLGSAADELPLDVRVGLAKRLRYVPLLLSLTGYNLNRLGDESSGGTPLGDALRHVALGGEFQFSESFNVRFGYNHRRHQDLKMKSRLDMAGLGVGFGIKITSFRLDYAFNSWSTLGGLHHFTVRTVI